MLIARLIFSTENGSRLPSRLTMRSSEIPIVVPVLGYYIAPGGVVRRPVRLLRKERTGRTSPRRASHAKNYESGEVPYTACAPHPESGRHVPQGRSSDLLPAARLPALRGAVAKSVRTDAELTATGIVPESHRSSLFIPHRRRPAGKPCTKTKIGHAAGSSNGAPCF